jgi:hypothetical protein
VGKSCPAGAKHEILYKLTDFRQPFYGRITARLPLFLRSGRGFALEQGKGGMISCAGIYSDVATSFNLNPDPDLCIK